MISPALQNCLNLALALSIEREHEHLTLEHLLFSLLKDPDISNTIEVCGAHLGAIAADIERIFDKLPVLHRNPTDREIQSTLAFQRVLQRSALHVRSAGKREIEPANVLVAMFSEKESQAVYVLHKHHITRLDIVSYISHGLVKGHALPEEDEESAEEEAPPAPEAPSKSALARFTRNLVDAARAGKIDPLVGRTRELTRTFQVLCRRQKNNPLLIGEAGVGKTAIAEGLALAIAEGRVPKPLLGSQVYSLDLGALLAGTKFRGDFEQRIKDVLNELKKERKAVLFIDEIHTIIGAGATSGGSLDASNLLKPALASGEAHCIGATTYKEYRNTFEKDRALSRRFQRIDVEEPALPEAVEILKGLKPHFERAHRVRYSLPALEAAVSLSAKYLSDRKLPDKAIDVIDEAGAAAQLSTPAKTRITTKDIEEIVSRMANIPTRSVSVSDKLQLKNLEEDLRLTLFGQDHAVSQVAEAIKLSRSGLGKTSGPMASFLFTGPTGVGKTELSKELARALGIRFLRFDMSEYMEKHSVSRLIGAPPGYVGFDQGGLLTDAVHKTPHAVVLLDEIEKAHPDIFNILLQVMDYGFLTDTNGAKTDFQNAFLIMTSNAGVRDLEKKTIGLIEKIETGSIDRKAIERVFSPEFRNRLDAIIPFNTLNEETIQKVVEKFLSQLEAQLLPKKVELEVDDSVRDWLAERGTDPLNGARPMARLVQEAIKRPLADAILFGDLERGGTATVTVKDGALAFTFLSRKALAQDLPLETT